MATYLSKVFLTKLLLLQVLCGMVSVGAGLSWGIARDLSKYDDKIYKNIFIAGIEVGNMTREEALMYIRTQYIDAVLSKEISLTLDDKLFKAPLKVFFEGSDLNEVINDAYDYPFHLNTLEKWFLLHMNSQRHFDITLQFNENAVYSFVADIISQINQDAISAAISISTNGSAIITPHSEGYLINKQALAQHIHLALSTYSQTAINISDFAVKKIPVHTTSSLESIDTCITSFSTSFTPNTNRATNIILSANAIDGTLLAPGDSFSFNNIVGNTTAEKGYKYAPVIINSKITQGIGGGICQVSSTLYNAILKIGLSPLNRKPHSKPVGYVPLGLDATVSFNSIDFEFVNTLDYPIYIQSYVEKDKLYVNIYSNHSLKDKTYKLKSEVYQVLPARVQYIYQTSGTSTIKKPVKVGSEGYKVKVIREVYDEDLLTQTEIISLDTYPPS